MKSLLSFFLIIFSFKVLASSFFVYNAGEGLFARVITEKYSVLIDTGSLFEIRKNLLKLKKNNNFIITDVILTHLHADHSSGIFEILDEFPRVNIYDNCMTNINVDDGDLMRWTDQFLKTLPKRMCINDKTKLIFDDVLIETLWPTGNFKSKNHNHYSLVLKITTKQKSVLVMGDALASTEKWLIENKLDKLKNIDVLVVGHHGSDAASTKIFLDIVNPNMAVIPANKNNIRGYPSYKTINRIKSLGINFWITGIHGDFQLKLN